MQMEPKDGSAQEGNELLDQNLSSASDNQDTPETFVAEDGGDIKSVSCDKNPGHKNFIPITDFKLENLPEEFQNDEYLKTILLWADLTVKVKVKYVSKDRPKTFKDSAAEFPNYGFRGSSRKVSNGSGYLFSVVPDEGLRDDQLPDLGCPCLVCQQSEETAPVQSWYFTVVTSIHVIYDSSEAARSIFQCFYDSDESPSSTANYLYGIKMYEQVQRNREKMSYVISVTHNKDLADKLQGLIKQRHDFVMAVDNSSSQGPAILISHPHGCSKTVTVGDVLYLTVPISDLNQTNKPTLFEEEMECIFPYRFMAKIPVMDFAQAHGCDPVEFKNSDLVSQGDSSNNQNTTISNVSNQTDALTTEPPDKCYPQTSDYGTTNPSPHSLSKKDSTCRNAQNEGQSHNGVLTSHSDSVTRQSKTESVMDNFSLSLSDKECTGLEANCSSVEDEQVGSSSETDKTDLNADSESFSVYYIDNSLCEGASLSVPDPDHLMSLTLPPRMTYTIPDGAEFARRYDGMKSLFKFPPGTKFFLSSGKEVYLPQEAQFYSNTVTIQMGYMCYNVDSCFSSSGGCMLLDGGYSFIHTFPHAGSLGGVVSRCGLRCYTVMPSAV